MPCEFIFGQKICQFIPFSENMMVTIYQKRANFKSTGYLGQAPAKELSLDTLVKYSKLNSLGGVYLQEFPRENLGVDFSILKILSF